MKKIIEAFLKEDCTIILHLDGNWTPLLPFFQDLPPRRIIMELENTDMKKAKSILGNRLCLKGNVPCSDLAFGTKSTVEDCCKALIDDCAVGGGFILSSGCEAPANAKPENIEAMIETAMTYGKY
jgi:uroporphyrinogen-III decarboxylase